MNSNKILILDKNAGLRKMAAASIGLRFPITFADDFDTAKKLLAEDSFSMLLLDADFGDKKSPEFCRQLKAENKYQNLPIIFLTEHTEVEKRILAYSMGADDLITKPIDPREFLARIELSLKRSSQNAKKTTLIIGQFRLDFISQKAFLTSNGKPEEEFDLTPIEFKLLTFFLKHESEMVSRISLMIAIWGDTIHISSSTLDTHISSLRKKLAKTPYHLQTLIKKGYIFSYK